MTRQATTADFYRDRKAGEEMKDWERSGLMGLPAQVGPGLSMMGAGASQGVDPSMSPERFRDFVAHQGYPEPLPCGIPDCYVCTGRVPERPTVL